MTSLVKQIPREAITQAVDYVKSLPQIEMQVEHSFADGVYCRQLTIPEDTVIVGKIHKHETLNVLLKGQIEIATESGGVSIMTAPYIFISPPGTQKIGRTLTETVWLNLHSTLETDLDKIEEHFIAQSFEEYDRYKLELTMQRLEGVN